MAPVTAFLLNDTSVSGHPGCVTVMSVIRSNLERRGIGIAGSWPVALDWKYGLNALPGYRNASVIVVNGEGTIHHTATRRAARQLAQSARNAKATRNVPVYLINATIVSIEAQDIEALRSFDHIYVRESQSHAFLLGHGFSNVDIVPDLCLTAAFSRPPRTARQVLTDSVIPAVTAQMKQRSLKTGDSFLPMQPLRAVSYLRWALHRSALKTGAAAYYEAIASAGSVITGRFHAVIFCLLAETPFLAIASNTPKIQSTLMDALGDDARMINSGDLERQTPVVPDFSEAELLNMRAYAASARDRAAVMFDRIAGVRAGRGAILE